MSRVSFFWVWGIARSNPQIHVLLYKDNFSKSSSFAQYGSMANALMYNLWWIVAYVLTVFCRQMWANVPAWLEAMCLWLGWGQKQAVKLYPCHGLLTWICCLAMWLEDIFKCRWKMLMSFCRRWNPLLIRQVETGLSWFNLMKLRYDRYLWRCWTIASSRICCLALYNWWWHRVGHPSLGARGLQ